MNRTLLLCLVPIVSLFAACGDSSGGTNPDPESSSSGTVVSSSSGEPSSSSVARSSSSIDGTTAAEYAELPAVIQLSKRAGFDVKYILGPMSSKGKGVYSMLVFDSTTIKMQRSGSYTWTDGVATLDTISCLRFGAGTDSLCTGQWVDEEMQFLFRNDSLLVSVDGSTLSEVIAGTLRLNPIKLSEASQVEGRWTRTTGDTTETIDFLADGVYLRTLDEGEGPNFEAGIYDIQNNYLFQVKLLCSNACYEAYQSSPTKPNADSLVLDNISMPDRSYSRIALPAAISADSVPGLWEGKPDTSTWQLQLNANGSADLDVYTTTGATAYASHNADWSVWHNLLVLDFTGTACTGNLSVGVWAPGAASPGCFVVVAGPAHVTSDSLHLDNSLIPTAWVRK